MASGNTSMVRLALPKGRMQAEVFKLLRDANISLYVAGREYRPTISLPNFEVKIQKPQNIIEMLEIGSRDIGFAGKDWVLELNASLVEVLDTKLDPVTLVAASFDPEILDKAATLPKLRVASEYELLTKEWLSNRGLHAQFIRSYGATEVFPPEDAEVVVDNTATGATLAANGLYVLDKLLSSSTRLYANPRSLDDPQKRKAIDSFVLMLRSVLEARSRVMLEVNVPKTCMDAVCEILPSMRQATIAPLFNDEAVAIKAAVPREMLATLIPEIKERGGTDIVITQPANIIP